MTTTFQTDLLDIAWFVRPHGQEDPCCGDLSAAETRALAAAASGSCRTVQDIARALGVTRSGATRVVDRLEKRGLATRCCSSLDRRCTCVEPTAAGRVALSDMSANFDGVLAAVLAPLPPDRREELAASLAILADLVRDHQQVSVRS